MIIKALADMSMELFRIARKAKLPPNEKSVITALCDHMNDKTGLCCPSYETLSEDTGYERTTISRTIKKLRNRGIISWRTVRRAGQFGFNVYYIDRVALSHAAGIHVADNDNTELHSVPSPSGIVQRKPLVLTLDEPLVSDGLANEGDSGQSTLPASNENEARPLGLPTEPEGFLKHTKNHQDWISLNKPELMKELTLKGLRGDRWSGWRVDIIISN